MSRSALAGLVCLSAAACGKSEADVQPYRSAIKAEMRDPTSADFRNETVRTLWTAGGKRARLYCAEVNGANAYGGKTGYIPVRLIISTKGDSLYAFARTRNPIWIDKGMSNGFYLDCVRPDTQRDDGTFGKAFVGDYDRAMVDRTDPVISNDRAPEER